jgi:hypothetical protein
MRGTPGCQYSEKIIPVFKWFSYLYLHEPDKNELPSDDELYSARTVMKKLEYDYGITNPIFIFVIDYIIVKVLSYRINIRLAQMCGIRKGKMAH